MPNRLARWLIMAMVMALVIPASSPRVHAQTERPGQSPDGWINLGPAGAVVLRIAVSPNWPADQSLAALTTTGLIFSPNGGRTWTSEALPSRDDAGAGSLQSAGFVIAPRHQDAQAIFLRWGDLWRSVDAGKSWVRVLELHQRSGDLGGLTFSPAFAADGTALIVNGTGALSISRDGGSTWAHVEPATGQYVHRVRFAPDFLSSQIIVASVVGGPFAVYGSEREPEQATHHIRSAGVMLSEDGGHSWQSRSHGLEVDGVPYRYVNALALSPAFPSDGTIFAFAWGPLLPVTSSPTSNTRPAGLFRTTDRGANWSLVWHREAATEDRSGFISIRRYRAAIAIWPDFQQSGRGQLSLSSTNGAPSGAYCEVIQTTSHGAAWFTPERVHRSPGCPISILGKGSTPLLLSGRTYRSRDGGATWAESAPPGYFGNSLIAGAVTNAPDGTTFMAGRDGIWSLAPDPQLAPAQIP